MWKIGLVSQKDFWKDIKRIKRLVKRSTGCFKDQKYCKKDMYKVNKRDDISVNI